MRYAVDGYGVLSCVIGGMIDRMRRPDTGGSGEKGIEGEGGAGVIRGKYNVRSRSDA